MRLTVFIVILLLFPAIAFSSNLYKWRDSSGVLHITDTPPPSWSSEVVVARSSNVKRTVPSVSLAEYERVRRSQVASAQGSVRQAPRDRQAERLKERRYGDKKSYLEAQIRKYSDAINIWDPKTTRDYNRSRRDYYREQLKIHRRNR